MREAGARRLDSAAAWAVRPFPPPRALCGRAAHPARPSRSGALGPARRFGIVPSEGWPEADPWTAPTAWSAWSLAALGERRPALGLLADLRRAATPAGAAARARRRAHGRPPLDRAARLVPRLRGRWRCASSGRAGEKPQRGP